MDTPSRFFRRLSKKSGRAYRKFLTALHRSYILGTDPKGRLAWKQHVYRLIGNAPYVNCYGFLALADHYLLRHGRDCNQVLALGNGINITKTRPNDIYYVTTARLLEFFKDIEPEIPQPYVLISGRLDGIITKHHHNLINSRLKHWFAINVQAPHPKITAIPLGLQTLDEYFINWDFTSMKLLHELNANMPDKDLQVLLSFTDANNQERTRCREQLANKPFVTDVWHDTMRHYWPELCRHRFVLSPPGLEPDCFRHWNTWLAGSFPIMKKHPVMEPFAHLPAWYVNDWSDVKAEDSERKWAELLPQRHVYPELFQHHWVEQIAEELERPDLLEIVPKPDLDQLPLAHLQPA